MIRTTPKTSQMSGMSFRNPTLKSTSWSPATYQSVWVALGFAKTRRYEAPDAVPGSSPDAAPDGVRKFTIIARPHAMATTFTVFPHRPSENGALLFGHPRI